MKYLVPRMQNKKRAHLWIESPTGVDGDSWCRMYSTGGMAKKKYIVADKTLGHEVCQNCINVARQNGVHFDD